MELTWRHLTLLRKEIKEVIESRENSGNGILWERWNNLKHFHAVTHVWSVLGETAWRMDSSRACATWTFCKIIFQKVWEGWSKLQGDSLASLRRRETRVCLMYTWSMRSRQSVFPYKCSAESLCLWFGMRWIYKCKMWTSLRKAALILNADAHLIV